MPLIETIVLEHVSTRPNTEQLDALHTTLIHALVDVLETPAGAMHLAGLLSVTQSALMRTVADHAQAYAAQYREELRTVVLARIARANAPEPERN
jgi:4-amino-4-deoxy-L-arabinose transferase-like glycosyltransferase